MQTLFLTHTTNCLYVRSQSMTSSLVAHLNVSTQSGSTQCCKLGLWLLGTNDSLVCLSFYISLVVDLYSNSIFCVIVYLLVDECSIARDRKWGWLMSEQGGGTWIVPHSKLIQTANKHESSDFKHILCLYLCVIHCVYLCTYVRFSPGWSSRSRTRRC